MSECRIGDFCEKIKEMCGAAECRSFSGRVESITALFESIELGPKDCVYLSALASSEVVRAILNFGAVPVFCDVMPDSFTIDHRSLDYQVKQTINVDQLYPRAVIADDFCGMPFSLKAVKDICDRMGLILIEDCGRGFGGSWEGKACGTMGDYTLISLGESSVFGTGGSGCLVLAGKGNNMENHIRACEGGGYQTADDIYAAQLGDSVTKLPETLALAAKSFSHIAAIMTESDFWLQRGSGRQKSSCAGTVVTAQGEAQCEAALASFEAAGLSRYARRLHVHRKSCFEHGCRGLKNIENASAVAPRSFEVDILGAVNSGKFEELAAEMEYIARNIHA